MAWFFRYRYHYCGSLIMDISLIASILSVALSAIALGKWFLSDKERRIEALEKKVAEMEAKANTVEISQAVTEEKINHIIAMLEKLELKLNKLIDKE